jgi:hypothetical protein
MDVRRYLLVLDRDLLAVDEQCEVGPIDYLVARQEHEQCEVVVVSLATDQTQSAAEMLIFAQLGRMPLAPPPDSGSYDDLVTAVRLETRSHDYNEVILATGRHEGSGVARLLGRDPVHQLRRKWGQRLIVFPDGHDQESSS